MSIASRITSIEGHIGDIYDSVELTGVDTTDIDKNLVNVPNTLKEGYIDIINNGTDTLYNNFPKVSGEGTSLTLNNTYQAPMRNNLKGNTSQTGTPTPTSPIPVNVVSGDNTITISNQGGTDSNTYNIDLPVENLFIPTLKVDDTNISITRCTVSLSGDEYTFSATGNDMYFGNIVTSGTSYQNIFGTLYDVEGVTNLVFKLTNSTFDKNYVCYYDKNKVSLGFNQINNSTGLITPVANTKYISFRIGKDDSVSGTSYSTKFQLEKGSKANSYTPYGTTPIELCKIGNYQDYFYKENGKWYLHKEIKKVVLNGSEEWTGLGGNAFYTPTQFGTYDTGVVWIIADKLLGVARNDITGKSNYICLANDGNIRIDYSGISSVTTLKATLSSNNISAYYVLATPTNTEITDTTLINQLEQFYQAQSKENQTNISQINNDLGFIISASALKKG